MKKRLLCSIIAMLSTTAFAQVTPQDATSQYFETIKSDPVSLLVFLQKMPKGGDLHNHLGGASMAENMMSYAVGDHLCIDPKTLSVEPNPKCDAANMLDNAPQNAALYNSIIDAWSMRNFYPGKESGHDHFFAVFGKYLPITSTHNGNILTEVVDRAGQQNEQYLELMVTPDNDSSGMLGKQVGWDPDLAVMRKKLLNAGLNNIVNYIIQSTNADETKMNSVLHCGTQQAAPGCHVKVRYLYQVLREQSPAQVFGQLLAGFEAVSKDPRFVGINMVQPEDGVISMRDYKLHMQMVGFLHKLYPNVHITLHAGELNSALVPPDGLRFHIRDAIETAHAERIGHGTDVAYEDDAAQLLHEMAAKQVAVEISLSSSKEILGVSGNNHPIQLYLKSHVPVVLSTDDEGVLRTDLTQQYQQAILNYQFTYPTIKMLVRNNIYYNFLPGKNLWKDQSYQQIISECANDSFAAEKLSASCQAFLSANEKASSQWELEKRFVKFEDGFKA